MPIIISNKARINHQQKAYLPDSDKEYYVISKEELELGTKNFKKYFRTQNTVDIGTRVVIDCLEIQSLVAGHFSDDNEEQTLVVVIYQGLNGNELVKGIRIVKKDINPDSDGFYELHPALDSAEGKLPSHEFVKDKEITVDGKRTHLFKLIPADNAKWANYQNDYFTSVQVHRRPKGAETPSMDAVQPDTDPIILSFPWSLELKELMSDNRSFSASGNLFYIFTDFSLFAALPNKKLHVLDENGYYHSVCITTAYDVNDQEYKELLEDGTVISTLAKDGVDYGNPCPPRCKKVKYGQ